MKLVGRMRVNNLIKMEWFKEVFAEMASVYAVWLYGYDVRTPQI